MINPKKYNLKGKLTIIIDDKGQLSVSRGSQHTVFLIHYRYTDTEVYYEVYQVYLNLPMTFALEDPLFASGKSSSQPIRTKMLPLNSWLSSKLIDL